MKILVGFTPGTAADLAARVKDFAPLSQVFIAANGLAVPPERPVKSVPERVTLAKEQP